MCCSFSFWLYRPLLKIGLKKCAPPRSHSPKHLPIATLKSFSRISQMTPNFSDVAVSYTESKKWSQPGRNFSNQQSHLSGGSPSASSQTTRATLDSPAVLFSMNPGAQIGTFTSTWKRHQTPRGKSSSTEAPPVRRRSDPRSSRYPVKGRNVSEPRAAPF